MSDLQDKVMDTDVPRPKGSWFRRIAVSLLVLLVLLGGMLVYLQTSHGFRHVIVPLVASLTRAEVSVRDGFVSLPGTLSIDGLQYRAEEQGIEVEAERVYLSLSLQPVFSRHLPVIRDLELTKAAVTLTKQEEVDDKRPRKPRDSERGFTSLLIPLSIERARIQEFSLTRLASNGTMIVREASVTVDNLQPGQTGSIKVITNFSHERGPSAVPVSGTVALDLALEQNPSGTVFRWNGSDTIVMESDFPETDGENLQAVTFAQTLSGQYESTTRNLHLVSSVAARRGEDSLGKAGAEVRVEGEKDQQPMEVRVKIEELTGEALTMLLMGVSPAHFASGRINGEVQISRVGSLLGMRTALVGRQISISGGDYTTPPVNFRMDQMGSFDQSSEVLSLETLNMEVSDGTRQLVTAKLERPAVMSLAHRSDETVQTVESPEQGKSSPAAIKLRLHALTARDLQLWLTVAGKDPLTYVTDGQLTGTVDLTVFNEGRALDLTGRLSFTKVMVQTQQGSGVLGPLELGMETHATLIDFTVLKLEPSTAWVSLQTKQVGRSTVSGSIHLAHPFKIQNLEGTVNFNRLPLETINPLLAARSPARVQRAVLDGGARVEVAGDRISWDLKLQGSEISLRLPDMAGPTPPLDVHVEQTGSFDRNTDSLHLEAVAINVLESGRPVIVGTLDKPLTVPLSRRDNRERSDRSPRITLTLDVSRLDVRQIAPWMALTRHSVLSHARQGEMTGRFQINVQGTADQIDLDGNLDLVDLQIERSGTHIKAAPVTIRSRLRAAISNLDQIKLETSSIKVISGEGALAEINGTGMVDRKNETADLKVQVASGNLTETLDRLGILTPKQRRLVDGGDFKSESTVATSGLRQPIRIATTMRLDKLTVRLDAHHIQTNSLTGQGAIVVNGERNDLHFQQVGMTLVSDGQASGTFTLGGHWPLGGGASSAAASRALQKGAAEFDVTVKGWDAKLAVSFFDVFPGRAPGPFPVNLAVTVRHDPAHQVMMLHGSGSIGPLHPLREGEPAEPKTVQFEEALTRHGDEVRIPALTLTTQPAKGAADRVTLSGNIHLGARPRVQARGKVESLDARWVADLFADPAKNEQPEVVAGAAAAAPMAPAHTGKGFPADLDVEVEIGSLNYRGLRAEQGRLIARGTAGNLHTTLSSTKLAGGTVEARFDVTMIQNEPHTKWSARARNVPFESVHLAFQPQEEPRVIGLASFDTSGSGRGSGETLKKTLTGMAIFDLKNGRFVKSPMLKYIAEQTMIDEFEHMGFDTLHGELELKDGWVRVKRLHAESPILVLDSTGRVGLDGTLDLKTWPRVSAGLAKKVGGACFAPLLHTVDGFTMFPFAVVGKGTLKQPEFEVEMRVEDIVRKNVKLFAGGIFKTLEGCGSLPIKGGAEAIDAIKNFFR